MNGGHERIDIWDNRGVICLDPDWMTEDERQALRQPTLQLAHVLPGQPMLNPREPATLSIVANDDWRDNFPTPDVPTTPVLARVIFDLVDTAPPL